MNFIKFKEKLQKHVAEMLQNSTYLFITDIDKDKLWEIYLESFPPGTNKIFRKKREHDCSCCRHFIKSFGNVVTIKNNKLISIWDFGTNSTEYKPVINTLSLYVKSAQIKDVFITKESRFGVDQNYERKEDGTVRTWDHFEIKLSKQFITTSTDTVDTLKGQYRDIRNVFKRSLEEISKNAIEIVLDLIAQKSLYKGKEWKHKLEQFLLIHKEYDKLPTEEKDLFCWIKFLEVGGIIGKIKNHVIGTLLTDITNDVNLNVAVRKWGNKVDPENYKHPKTIYSKKDIDKFEKTIIDSGYRDSLRRRFATIEDITINNIIFANKSSLKTINEDIFGQLRKEAFVNPKKFNEVQEITIENFIKDVVPRATNIELYVENRHKPNFVSMIAPLIKDSKNMLKWNNPYTWTYADDLTDSMKERVKTAGGRVDGILRYSIQWNDGKICNHNDFDAHSIEPNGNHIYYPNKFPNIHESSARLDVDIIKPIEGKIAVENITWINKNKMLEGRYKFQVHCYSYRGGKDGFKAEIEYNGQLYSYEYNKSLQQNETVLVADIEFSKTNGIKFINSLKSTHSSQDIWNIKTNEFHPVSVCMYSPNYWNKQSGIGHQHYFFILKGCHYEGRPRGLFNEFIKEDLLKNYKRIFEALGNKTKVESSNNQLSGLGFSSTENNFVICKVEGHVSRILKITF